MKKKVLIILCFLLLTLACARADLEVNLRNDDSGIIIFKVGYEESYLKGLGDQNDFEINPNFKFFIPYENSEEITFEKNNKTYIGKKSEIKFNSLMELEHFFNQAFDEKYGINKVYFTRDGNKVKVYQESNLEVYEGNKISFSYIDWTISFKLDGKVLNHNADKFDKNKLEWGRESFLKKGIEFEYKTKNKIKKEFIYIGCLAIILFGYLFKKGCQYQMKMSQK